MIKNPRLFVAALIVGAALLLLSTRAHAQAPAVQTSSIISFDALPRANKNDTTGKARVTRPAPVAATHTTRIRTAADPFPATKIGGTVSDSTHPTRIGGTVAVRVDTVRAKTDTIVVTKPAAAPAVKSAVDTAAKSAAKSVVESAVKSEVKSAVSYAPTSVSGLLQVMLSGGDSALKSTYRIRRAEVKVVSDLGHKAQAVVMVDVSKALSLTTSGTATSVSQSSRVLQDAYLVLPIAKVTIEAGQQRLPLGYEGSMGASSLETVDRALFESDKARNASFGDVRDLGAAVRGKWRFIDYRAGVYNGSGENMNDVDKNVAKTVAGQLAFRPTFAKGLRIGASGVTSGKATGDKPARDRVGADVVYTKGKGLIQAEVMSGQDGTTRRAGLYTLGALNLLPSLKVVARFDAWDPNTAKETAAGDVTERDYLVGFTWLPPATRLKAQFAVTRKTYTHAITPSVTLALTQLQASW